MCKDSLRPTYQQEHSMVNIWSLGYRLRIGSVVVDGILGPIALFIEDNEDTMWKRLKNQKQHVRTCAIRTSHSRALAFDVDEAKSGVALTFFRRYKRSDWRFCACAINVKSSICSETTKYIWYKYYCLFVGMHIIYLQINTRQTSVDACFDSKPKSRDCMAP